MGVRLSLNLKNKMFTDLRKEKKIRPKKWYFIITITKRLSTRM